VQIVRIAGDDDNPSDFSAYDGNSWGITAGDGPRPATYIIKGKRGGSSAGARGAPYGPDDGSIAPWAVAASLPFAPEIVQPSHFETLELRRNNTYGFKATFNEKAFGDFWKPFATIRTDITQ
jgi:hypothetical protein